MLNLLQKYVQISFYDMFKVYKYFVSACCITGCRCMCMCIQCIGLCTVKWPYKSWVINQTEQVCNKVV